MEIAKYHETVNVNHERRTDGGWMDMRLWSLTLYNHCET